MFVFRILFFLTLTSAFLMTCHSHNVTAGCRPLDVVFLIDSSGSENNDSFNAQLEFMKELVQSSDSYNNNTKFGAVSFSNEAKLEFNLNQYSSSADVIRAIKNITRIGKFTHIEEGFKYVSNVIFTNLGGDRPDADNVLLVLTDGIFHPENASEPAEILLGNGVKISLVLFTDRVTDKLNNNAQSITNLNNTFTKDTFEPMNLFCPDTSTSIPISPTITSSRTGNPANLGCRDHISRCASYGVDICSRFKSWAEVQCRCFCKFDEVTITRNTTRDPGTTPVTVSTHPKIPQHVGTTCHCATRMIQSSVRFTRPGRRSSAFAFVSFTLMGKMGSTNQQLLATSKTSLVMSSQMTKSTTQNKPLVTSSQQVSYPISPFLSCFTCDDYLTFRCQSFATKCDNTCMIRYKDGRLQTKCTLDLECRNAQQNDFLNLRSSTRCCRNNTCVSGTLQQAILVHHKQTGGQTTSAVGMVSIPKVQQTSTIIKQTISPSVHKSTATTKPVVQNSNASTAKSTIPLTQNVNASTAKSTSTVQKNSTLPQKTSSQQSTVPYKSTVVPLTKATTRPWPFVTIPIGRRRKVINAISSFL